MDLLVGIVGSLTGAVLILLANWAWNRARTELRTRRGQHFWKPFLAGDLKLVVGGFSEFTGFEQSGLLGVGDAMAMAELRAHFKGIGLPDVAVTNADLLGGDSLKSNLILLGGPDANKITKDAVVAIDSTFQFGDPSEHVISFYDSETGKTYAPSKRVDSQDIERDYGVIIKTDNPFAKDKKILIIAGSFGYGTWAGARFTMGEKFLSNPSVKAGHSVEALIKTDVSFGAPQEIELVAIRELKGQ